MLQERGRGAVLVGVARVDAALEHLLQALMAGLIQSLSKHRAGVVAAPLPVMP
jgi:hypothetical protein